MAKARKPIWVILVDDKFFVRAGKTSDEYPNAWKFDTAEEASEVIESYKLKEIGSVQLILNLGQVR